MVLVLQCWHTALGDTIVDRLDEVIRITTLGLSPLKHWFSILCDYLGDLLIDVSKKTDYDLA